MLVFVYFSQFCPVSGELSGSLIQWWKVWLYSLLVL